MSELDTRYSAMVQSLSKPGAEIADQMSDNEAHLLHMAVGICGEAGELLDAIKKHVIYKKRLDIVNVIEELGDLEFYMQGMRNQLKIMRITTLQYNMDKLRERYPDYQYTDQRAQDRADKT